MGTFADGGVRFQGHIPRPAGCRYLDRTTPRPLENRRVHQHIEISLDGGDNRQTTFHAVYVPAEGE